MMHAYLIRRYHDTHTQGALIALDDRLNVQFSCVTLELPWRDNASRISCIPEGIYRVCTRKTDKFGLHYHIQDVPGREWILFHPASYVRQLLGCIIPGERYADLDKDAIPDIVNTKATLNAMLAVLGKEFTLNIFTAPHQGGTLPTATITA